MQKIVTRLRREPLVSRAVLAAALNVLVAVGVLDVHASQEVQDGLVALVNAVLLVSARQRVAPLDVLHVLPTAEKAVEEVTDAVEHPNAATA